MQSVVTFIGCYRALVESVVVSHDQEHRAMTGQCSTAVVINIRNTSVNRNSCEFLGSPVLSLDSDAV